MKIVSDYTDESFKGNRKLRNMITVDNLDLDDDAPLFDQEQPAELPLEETPNKRKSSGKHRK